MVSLGKWSTKFVYVPHLCWFTLEYNNYVYHCVSITYIIPTRMEQPTIRWDPLGASVTAPPRKDWWRSASACQGHRRPVAGEGWNGKIMGIWIGYTINNSIFSVRHQWYQYKSLSQKMGSKISPTNRGNWSSFQRENEVLADNQSLEVMLRNAWPPHLVLELAEAQSPEFSNEHRDID